MKFLFNTNAFKHHYDEISLTDNIAEAEFLVMGAKTVQIEKFSKLKAVYRFGVGSENVPFEYLKEKGISVYFPSDETKKILYDSTANFTVWLIFYMHFNKAYGCPAKWEKYTRDYLGSKNLLVIGRGNIGTRVIDKMKPFMKVTSFDKAGDSPSKLKGLISSADYISLHIPAGAENDNFVDAEKLSWMKETAVLVNTSRGQIVNEASLHKRLIQTQMRAAFDVFWKEPYKGILSELPADKFFITPHTASQTKEFVESAFLEIINISKGLKKK